MITLDKTTRDTSLQELSREFRKVDTQWGVLRNIADTPFFADSRTSRLARRSNPYHVAYSAFRRYNSGDAPNFDLIAHRFDSDENVIHGLAHKHGERHLCTCPFCLSRRFTGGRGDPVVRWRSNLSFVPAAAAMVIQR